MKPAVRVLVSAATVAAVAVLAAGTASAQPQKCHAAIAKNITKYQATLWKTVTGCHKSRTGGKIAITENCNDVDDADQKLKLGGARTKVRDGIAKACVGVGDMSTVLDLYGRCPIPADATDDGPPTDGIDDFEELSDCLIALSDAYVGQASDAVMGEPDATVAEDKDAAKCQGAIGKAVSKAFSTTAGERSKCQAAAEKTAGIVAYTTCATTDPNGKIAPAIAAVDAAINASCNLDADRLGHLHTCATTPAELVKCIGDRVVDRLADGLVAAAIELPGVCPVSANVLINAGYGLKQTGTRLDSGYTGLAHGVDVIDRYIGSVNLVDCDADCDSCEVELDPTPVGVYAGYSTCRCSNDVTVSCDDAINAMSADCGGSTCHCNFGPPLPLSSANAPVCVVNRFQGQFVGETSGLGGYEVTTSTKALVFLGISASKPCPTCDDPPGVPVESPNDGVRSGTCSDGPRAGQTCDINATSLDFGATSFDCPPDLMDNISGTGLGLALEFSSGSQSITAGVTAPGCTSGPCHCMQCTGDATVGCSSDAQCAGIGAGTCDGGTLSKLNGCDDLVCDPLADDPGIGICPNAPTVSHCDGFVRADDRNGALGVVTCNNQADCDATDPECPGGDCGVCVPDQIRSCFPNTISAEGHESIFESTGVSAFCTAQTSNVGVNNAGGLPGPGRVKLDFSFDLFCPDGTTPFEMPGGTNCP